MSDSEMSDAPDAWLWKVLQKHKNREMIAILEDTLTSFVHDDQQSSLRFPPRNAFHRRVCHAVARRYQLAHKLEPIPDAHLSSDALRLVLIKTSHSSVPTHRLQHFAALPPPAQHQQSSCTQQQQNALSDSSGVHADDYRAHTSTNTTSNPSQQPQSAAIPARFLRRPTTGNLKPARPRIPPGSSSLSSASAPALRSITEEDYRKARARIFKPSASPVDINTNPATQLLPESGKQDQVLLESQQSQLQSLESQFQRVVKLSPGSLAKGPVQGSTGFERRRNRRQSTAEPNSRTQSSQQPEAPPLITATSSMAQSRQNSSQENSRSSSIRPRTDSRTSDLRSTSTSTPVTNAHSACSSMRRQSIYSSEPKNVDLQDPDFDRRYDKWAVRHPTPQQPPPQHIPVPIFSQLLYPYAVQAPHHVHPSNMHISQASAPIQQPITQFQSMMHHSSNLVFHHAGHTGPEYETRVRAPTNVSTGFVSNRVMDAGETVVTTSQAFANRISTSSIGAQVVQRASPAYGLDSTVDFPPLQ
ncbi:unnamed protein product [Agarophyton chilense]|eukprot:gb/GEZJ01001140.1/.p1 GENE.gb/GEZJ01001140.1/~~gb/GEZJ01001140.1/.p1  ORF type:complete len:583 (-),score=63.87 gb/GEZJ01001140.1/:5696-7282(-)